MLRREIRVRIHIVQKGDTLWKIAKKYGVNFEELKKVNSHISNPDLIMPGMKIKVPTTGGPIKKKEMPMDVKKEAPIGAPKKMPKKEIPKPQPLPIVETPKEQPKVPEEVPIMPFTPIMPQPSLPEIDVNNYYMVNMANMSLQQLQPQLPQLPQQPQIQPKPQLYLKPKPLPSPKPIVMEEAMESSEIVELPEIPQVPEMPLIPSPPLQGGCYQPMLQCPKCCTPITPVIPGSGLYNYHPYTQQMPTNIMAPPQMPYMQPAQVTMPMTHVQPGVVGENMMDVESPPFMDQMGGQMPGATIDNDYTLGTQLGGYPQGIGAPGMQPPIHPQSMVNPSMQQGYPQQQITQGMQLGAYPSMQSYGSTPPMPGTQLGGFAPGMAPAGTGYMPWNREDAIPGTVPAGMSTNQYMTEEESAE